MAAANASLGDLRNWTRHGILAKRQKPHTSLCMHQFYSYSQPSSSTFLFPNIYLLTLLFIAFPPVFRSPVFCSVLFAIDRFLCEWFALTSTSPSLWYSITSTNFSCSHLRAFETALLGFVLNFEAQRGEVACSRPVIVALPGRRHAVWEGCKKETQVARKRVKKRLC